MNNFKDKETFTKLFKENIIRRYAIPFEKSTPYQQYVVLGKMLMEEIGPAWYENNEIIRKKKHKVAHYFSMEFLMGRMITNNLQNYGVYNVVKEAFNDLGIDLDDVEHREADAGLGNGGLGRLAACFLDSSASLGLPVMGQTIRYRYGFFKQIIQNGYQVESPDVWLKDRYVWEIRRQEEAVNVPFYGNIEIGLKPDGSLDVRHINAEYVKAVPYDMPIIGDNNGVVNTLRMWNAEPSDMNFSYVTHDYHRKVREISEMLYPNDETVAGKILRLKQQYFFSSAGINSIIKRHLAQHGTVRNLADYVVFQINDTHPTLIIPELMRILVDEQQLEWDEAWEITTKICAYTNHTILYEALEVWPINIFKQLLPRIYTITEEIDRRFVESLEKQYGRDTRFIPSLRIIKDNVIRMANLAIVGSFSVNGVAKLHTSILKDIVFADFNSHYPNKFNNKTNGITHRRWCYHINPELVSILSDTIGNDWVKDASKLKGLLKYENDPKIQKRYKEMKLARKTELANIIYHNQQVELNPKAIFDIQVKRLHEYKRQLMKALGIMAIYNKLKSDLDFRNNYHPHVFIFGAKAAPTYYFAKKVIKLINTIADKVNNDEDTNNLLKVVFVEDYNVSYAEKIMPAADVSEQISTASKEASGTGNMKFMMNGAITLGTLDGANVEINELVGDDNMQIFGLTADMVTALERNPERYNPMEIYENDLVIKEVLDQLTNGFFDVPFDEFKEIKDSLIYRDKYFVLKDLNNWLVAQDNINKLYKDEKKWYQMAIHNTAMSGYFSADRTILDYNRDIWHLKPLNI
ncbi:MAG: glycogen/starch/alpha-glucan phosphorylase [Acholeplasmataceae bacterium]|jgi:starch phosphorylase